MIQCIYTTELAHSTGYIKTTQNPSCFRDGNISLFDVTRWIPKTNTLPSKPEWFWVFFVWGDGYANWYPSPKTSLFSIGFGLTTWIRQLIPSPLISEWFWSKDMDTPENIHLRNLEDESGRLRVTIIEVIVRTKGWAPGSWKWWWWRNAAGHD
jgi:hypothetical protein